MNKENEIEIQKLKEIREKLNLSQVTVAKELGVTKQYYNKVEKGLTALSKEKAIQLCKAYGISFEWFFGDGKQMLLEDEVINENLIQDMGNFNNLAKILKAYNLYLKYTCEIIDKDYPEANYEDKIATANVLFNNDCLDEKIPFNDLKSLRKTLEKKNDSPNDFEIRVIGTYYPIAVEDEIKGFLSSKCTKN
jgi:transcriptional regulator with XRE-family HTH domain